MQSIIPVCFMFDDNYTTPALVTLYSMLKNADRNYFYKLFVVQAEENITEKSKEKLRKVVNSFQNASIEFRVVKKKLDTLWDGVFAAHFSKEILLKLMLPSIFSDFDKIICSDVDVVFSGDISKSFTDFNLKNYYIAGIRALEKIDVFIEKQRYSDQLKSKLKGGIGAGYMVYNLDYMRKEKIERKLLENFKKYKTVITQPEQDILNMTIPNNKILYLPLKYMFCTYMYRLIKKDKILDLRCSGSWFYYLSKKWKKKIKSDKYHSKENIEEAFLNPVQIHYATGVKPWNTSFCYKKLIWLKYRILSYLVK